MGMEARNLSDLPEDVRTKFLDAVEALAACGFGPEGPPRETAFAQIEEFGHGMGRMFARALEENLTDQHADHFRDATPCPNCGTACRNQGESIRSIQTIDGEVPLREPKFQCPACRRDFFPSASNSED